jgi:hypothetical protein
MWLCKQVLMLLLLYLEHLLLLLLLEHPFLLLLLLLLFLLLLEEQLLLADVLRLHQVLVEIRLNVEANGTPGRPLVQPVAGTG